MSLQTTPHLNLRGQARQALEFYRTVFGGQAMLVTYRDAGRVADPADADHVMWGQVTGDNGFRVMAYDVPAGTPWNAGENAFFVSVRGDSPDEVARHWAKLSDGATVLQPLGPAGWSPLYGMLKDRFGVTWVVDVAVAHAPPAP